MNLPKDYRPRAARIGKRFVATCDAVYPNGSVVQGALLEKSDQHSRLPLYDTEELALIAAKQLREIKMFQTASERE